MDEKAYIKLREGAAAFYQLIEKTTQRGPERAQALLNVEQALMWANTALSRKESGVRREELFLGRLAGLGPDWHHFTLNPLAKADPKRVKHHCSCGTLLVGPKAECPNQDCDQRR